MLKQKYWRFFGSSANDASGILSWIKTKFGKWQHSLRHRLNPNNDFLKKQDEFMQLHATVLANHVNDFFARAKSSPSQRFTLLGNYNRNWKKYVAKTNTLNHEFKLLPDGFLEMVREQDATLVEEYLNNTLKIIKGAGT